MKVLFSTYAASSVLGGGVDVQVRALAREATALGIQVELFDPWRRYRLEDYDLFHLFASHAGTYHIGRALHGLGVRLLLTPVFYSRHSPAKVAAMLIVAKRLRSRGGFWTEHMFCKELCDMAELLLPNTREEMEMMARAFGVPAARMVELPNGVEERFLDSKPDAFVQEYGLKDFILYVGHIGWGRKNVLPLLNVLRRTGHPAVLIGPVIQNDYARRCREVVESSPNIRLIPGLPSDSPLLESAYAACDTLVLPSFYETPGLAALEAGLAGAKVCITRYGGTTEYFGEHASYLDPRSEESIEKSLNASLGRAKDVRLRDRIAASYLWRHAGKRLVEAYSALTPTS
ncbi:glycosyltransferase family 4 protein [candidate division WOR-3 bacterium]|nr:glycosyltransferase family 4 protein [candidate division WOR-3 bacterium]